MRRNQSTSVRLLLDPHGSGPAHQRVADAVRAAIRDGRLVPGDALPASRNLAADLGVSRWVVTEAYQQLGAEGYLIARAGAATRVTDTARPSHPMSAPARRRGGSPAESAGALDLRPGRPDLAAFPRSAWATAYAAAVRTVDPRALGYPDPCGVPELRATVADYLRRVRGLDTDPSGVIITGGTNHGLRLLLRALGGGGATRMAVEDPGWTRLWQAAADEGLAAEPVPVDDHGIVVDQLPAGADLVLVTPAHQFPTGAALSAERRAALLGWATSTGAVVAEDDYDAEFRYDHRPLGALAGLDRYRVAYLGSVSKTLAPALRLGWLVPPPGLHDAARALAAEEPARGALEQYALATLIAGGGYDRHLRRMRRDYRARRDALLAALHARLPQVPVAGVAAGLHLLLRLPSTSIETAAADHLAAAGVLTTPLSRYQHRSAGSGLVLSFAHLPPHHAPAVARHLAHALQLRHP